MTSLVSRSTCTPDQVNPTRMWGLWPTVTSTKSLEKTFWRFSICILSLQNISGTTWRSPSTSGMWVSKTFYSFFSFYWQGFQIIVARIVMSCVRLHVWDIRTTSSLCTQLLLSRTISNPNQHLVVNFKCSERVKKLWKTMQNLEKRLFLSVGQFPHTQN